MNEEMKLAWLEISDMLGEPTREELDVFLRTWQRASQATRKALAEQPAQQEPVATLFGSLPVYDTSPPAQRTWVGLTPEELDEMFSKTLKGKKLVNWVAKAIEAKLKEKNNG